MPLVAHIRRSASSWSADLWFMMRCVRCRRQGQRAYGLPQGNAGHPSGADALRPNSLRARTDTGGSLPPSVVGIDPSGLVADTLARREALGFALVKSVVLPHDDLVNVRLIFSSELQYRPSISRIF